MKNRLPTKLKSITLKIGSGATPTGGENSYKSKGITLIRSLNVYDFHFERDGLAFIDEQQAKQLDNVEVVKSDILLNITGASVARCCMVPDSVLPARVNQHVSLVRIDPVKADPHYVLSCINSPRYKAELLAIAQGGATREALTKSKIESFEIPLPCLATQRKIASILSAYDDLIENNTRRIAILEAIAQAIYREWFVEFRFPGHEKLKLADSPLGKIPEGWTVKPLGEIAAITMGTSPKGDTYNEEGDGTPLVNGPVEFGERFTKQLKWTTAPTRFCKEGDLVVCVRGSTTGKYVKSDGVYCLGRGVCGLSSKYQCFVNLLFEHERPALLAQTGGSTFPSWTGPQLKFHLVVSPPDELLERFEELVKPMSVAVLVYSRQMENLRTTRDLLLPKLISGELDVEHLDIDVDDAAPVLEEAAS
jgi:type I restriction enzyme S subunit